MKKYYLAFDIETAALPWDSFSESQQEYLLRGLEDEKAVAKRKEEIALSPLTSQVVCVGLQLSAPTEQGGYEILKKAAFATDNSLSDEESRTEILSTGDECYVYNEKKVLENFWKIFPKYSKTEDGKTIPLHLVSFNGRNFDAPFLMLRSAILGIRPSRNLMAGTKYNYGSHTDLLDELTFFTPTFNFSATKRFNFDFFARAFGVTSPKAQGVDGSMVSAMFREGKIAEISEY